MALVKDKDLIENSTKTIDEWYEESQKTFSDDIKPMSKKDFEKKVKSDPPVPTTRNLSRLGALERAGVANKTDIYEVLKDLTPYLLRRLIFESYNASSSLNRIRAAKVILNKILPDVSASEVNLNVEDTSNLVIVKSKEEDQDKDQD